MTKFSESIVGKIKQEHIAPVPRWHFLLKSYVFWVLLGMSLLLGSLSFSVIAHLISIGDLDVLGHLQRNVIISGIMLLPYFWALSLVISTLVAYYNWKHTKFRYRFRRRWILVFSVGLSIFLGSILHAFGMGNAIDRIMVKSLPFYDASKHKVRDELWLQPEIGLIMGKVIKVDSVYNQIVIQDAQGRDWNIDEKAVVSNVEAIIKRGRIVKIIGKKNGENDFIAQEIRRCGDCEDDEDNEDDENNEDKREVKDFEKSKVSKGEDASGDDNDAKVGIDDEEKDQTAEEDDSDEERGE